MADSTLALEPAALPVDAVEVARIGDPWGVKGWFKVIPHSASPEALFSSRRWYLLPPERGTAAFTGPALLRIRQAKPHSDAVVVHVDGIEDRDRAQALKGARVHVPRSSFPTPGHDEFYWVDLIGLQVFNREGVVLGTVKELLSAGPQTTLVLSYTESTPCAGTTRERLIPFVSAYVDAVDVPGGTITVDWQADY